MEDDDVPSLVEASQPELREEPRETSAVATKVPITIVSGYLGAGKTTLMNYILKEQHGKRIAVILNEFGDSADIEKALTINEKGQEVQEWLELGNGCICCSVKDQGVNAIESLMERTGAFDYILLETSGVADPGNIAPLFWVDDGLGSTIYLDGIVVLVDAKNIVRSLDESKSHATNAEASSEDRDEYHSLTTAHLQLSHADVIVLNKTDTVTASELQDVRTRIRGVNGLASIVETQYGQIPNLEGVVLDLHAYDSVDAVPSTKSHGHPDPSISTVTFEFGPLNVNQLEHLDEWLRSVLWESVLPGKSLTAEINSESTWSVHRLKGRVVLHNGEVRMIQGVREVFEITVPKNSNRQPTEAGASNCKIVIIGRNVASLPWAENLATHLSNRLEVEA